MTIFCNRGVVQLFSVNYVLRRLVLQESRYVHKKLQLYYKSGFLRWLRYIHLGSCFHLELIHCGASLRNVDGVVLLAGHNQYSPCFCVGLFAESLRRGRCLDSHDIVMIAFAKKGGICRQIVGKFCGEMCINGWQGVRFF